MPESERQSLTRTDLVNSLMFLAPIVAVVTLLLMGRSPAAAGLAGTLTAMFAFINPEVRKEPLRLVKGLVRGGMASSAIMMAVGCIGILLGVLDLTGIGIKFAGAISSIGGENLWLALLVAAGSCLILGMGMPTFPAYLIIVLVLGPSIKALGIEAIAIHLFVFYYGVLSNITPPVAIADSRSNAYSNGGKRGRACAEWLCHSIFLVFDTSLLLVDGFEWTALFTVCAKLALSLWMFSTAVIGFDVKTLFVPERLLRATSGALLISIDPIVAGVGGLVAIAFIALRMIRKKSADAPTCKVSG